MEENSSPLIIGFVADLLFASRIQSVSERMGFRVAWIESAEQVAPLDPDAPKRQLGEHLIGPTAVLLDELTRLQPALIIFDLSNAAIPWREWIALIKSVPATRRIPVICFGSHVNVETMKDAKGRGADAVLARSRFISNLASLIEKYARLPDFDAIEEACQQQLSALALKGLEEFNRGKYFEAHEYLEEAWNEDQTPGRELYRAVLQVAVAYLQIERRNWKGAAKMFLRLRQWIDPLPDTCRGIDVARLRSDAKTVHQALMDLGPEHIWEFDNNLLEPVHYQYKPGFDER